jgi:hypothetical protein
MKITQDVREYAPQKQIDEEAALGVGMQLWPRTSSTPSPVFYRTKMKASLKHCDVMQRLRLRLLRLFRLLNWIP